MNRFHGAFISARYSTDNQNPDSIEVQVQKCTAWCNQNNIPILGIFADEAVSGMKDSRPRYAAMMEQLRMGLADTVVIYDQSRMFRKMEYWFAFRSELSNMGVTVVSVTQPAIGKDLRDPMNFVTEGSMALFNQMHALITRQKVMEKMRFMARNGQHTGGKPALGYHVVDGSLEICEAEAAIVRRIFTEYASGQSYREIIAGLNRDGLKTKRGNPFGTNSLHDLLKNEKYIGTLVYGAMPYREDGTRNSHAKDGSDVVRIENAIPAIIEKELFDIVQKKMAGNKRQGGRPAERRDYPLKGKVFCGHCKSAMVISISKGNYFYYRCSAQKRTHECKGRRIRVDELEEQVAGVIRQLFGNEIFVEELITTLNEQREEIHGGAVSALRSLIAERCSISAKLENASKAIMDGLYSPTLLEKVKEQEALMERVDAQILSLKRTVDAAGVPEMQLREALELCTKQTDVKSLFSIIRRIDVYDDHIEVWTILDPDPETEPDYHTKEGVTITPGTGFGVPTVFVTAQFIKLMLARRKSTS